MYLFSSRKSLFWVPNKETENFEVKITLESNIALGVQQTLGLLEQQTSLRIAMEFLSLRPANFSSSRNVALHARSLGPPWPIITTATVLLCKTCHIYAVTFLKVNQAFEVCERFVVFCHIVCCSENLSSGLIDSLFTLCIQVKQYVFLGCFKTIDSFLCAWEFLCSWSLTQKLKLN